VHSHIYLLLKHLKLFNRLFEKKTDTDLPFYYNLMNEKFQEDLFNEMPEDNQPMIEY